MGILSKWTVFLVATNALNKIDLPSYDLTQSFGFGDNFAKTLQSYLNQFVWNKWKQSFKISGTERNTKIGKSLLIF